MGFEYTGNWSFSSLQDYQECPYRFRLKRIDKLPELPREPDNPLERGNRVHDHLERFVKGTVLSLDGCEAKKIELFKPLLKVARVHFENGIASVEENWTFDRDWESCDKKDERLWLWAKLDLNVRNEPRRITVVVDYKTGKSDYKAIQHLKQMQLYAAIAALRQPWADTIIVELWYVDEGKITSRVFTREQALRFVKQFTNEAEKIYADQYFKPTPSQHACNYCAFGPRKGTGTCPRGV